MSLTMVRVAAYFGTFRCVTDGQRLRPCLRTPSIPFVGNKGASGASRRADLQEAALYSERPCVRRMQPIWIVVRRSARSATWHGNETGFLSAEHFGCQGHLIILDPNLAASCVIAS